MNRIAVTVAGCLLAFSVSAADPAGKAAAPGQEKKAGTTATTGTPSTAPSTATPTAGAQQAAHPQHSCGEMMAQNAPFPAAMANVTANVTELMNLHAAWMDKEKGKEAKAEAKAFRKLAKQHEDATKLLKKISEDLAAAKTWPNAPHDMKNVDMAQMGALMTKLAAAERELGALMTKHATEIESHVSQMKAAAAGGSGNAGHAH